MRTKRIILRKKLRRKKRRKKLKPFEITAEQEDEDNPRLMTAEKIKLNRVW